MYTCVSCVYIWVCVYVFCRLFSEALPSTHFHISPHTNSFPQNLFPLSRDGGQNCGRPSRAPGSLSDPHFSASPRCPQQLLCVELTHVISPRPCLWIGPDYVILLLKILCPRIRMKPRFLSPKGLLWFSFCPPLTIPGRGILLQTPLTPAEPGCIQCPLYFFLCVLCFSECPLSFICLIPSYLSILSPTSRLQEAFPSTPL